MYPEQLEVFSDTTPDRVYCATRQTGKTTLLATEIIDAGLSFPGCEVAYVDMSIQHGERVVMAEISRMLGVYDIAAKIVDKSLRFDNGSVAYIFSGQQSEVESLQGFKLRLFVCDETQDCAALDEILTMIRPALLRWNGRVVLTGVPGRVKNIGPWWDRTEGAKAGMFGQHRGTFWNNPFLPQDSKERLFEAAKIELGEKSGDFMRHWKGQWPDSDDFLRCYQYFPNINGYDGEPPSLPRHSLGLDLGGVLDAEAVVVLAHGSSEESLKNLIYHVDEVVSPKKAGGGYDVTGDRVGPMQDKWNCEKRFFDYGSANKSNLTLIYQRDRHIIMEAVPPKRPFIEIQRINRLFRERRLFIKRGSQLEKDLLYVSWDKETLGLGKTPKYGSIYKQDAADALRAAMWGVSGWLQPNKPNPPTEAEQEAKDVRELFRKPSRYGLPSEEPKPQSVRRGREYGPKKSY